MTVNDLPFIFDRFEELLRRKIRKQNCVDVCPKQPVWLGRRGMSRGVEN
jgi:hypothetical protein